MTVVVDGYNMTTGAVTAAVTTNFTDETVAFASRPIGVELNVNMYVPGWSEPGARTIVDAD